MFHPPQPQSTLDYELDSLADDLWQTSAYLMARLETKKTATRWKIISLAAYRRKHRVDRGQPEGYVKPGTFSARIAYVSCYLKYLGSVAVNAATDPVVKNAWREEMRVMVRALYGRIPDCYEGNGDFEYQRLGLSYEGEELLREAIQPGHHRNPWSVRTQLRNYMIVMILLGLGMRRGELLNLKTDDIDLRHNRVYIRRLPDNPDDPRRHEPNVKTWARSLVISDSLAAVIQDYLINFRGALKGARRHPFLVASSEGAPLSMGGLDDVFAAVRARVPGIPLDFSPHLCRHTWNDRYSDFCDEKGIDPERERKTRCKIMGWKPGSKMAETYTKRSSQKLVDDLLLRHQEHLSAGRLRRVLDDFTFTER